MRVPRAPKKKKAGIVSNSMFEQTPNFNDIE